MVMSFISILQTNVNKAMHSAPISDDALKIFMNRLRINDYFHCVVTVKNFIA